MSHYWSACLFFKGASFFLTAFTPAKLPSTFSKIQVKRNTIFFFRLTCPTGENRAGQSVLPCPRTCEGALNLPFFGITRVISPNQVLLSVCCNTPLNKGYKK